MEFLKKLGQMVARPLAEIGQEIDRQVVLGSAEIASTLNTGHAFVAYGQGQNLTGVDHGMENSKGNDSPEMQQEHDGRSL
jgi:hypothetical protein